MQHVDDVLHSTVVTHLLYYPYCLWQYNSEHSHGEGVCSGPKTAEVCTVQWSIGADRPADIHERGSDHLLGSI